MTNIVRIRRRLSGSVGAPSSLKNAELAFNEMDNSLYYGKGDDGNGNATSVINIAGSGIFVDKSTDQTVGGIKTFSSQIISNISTGTSPLAVTSTTKVTNLNVDKLDDQDGTYYLDNANATGTLIATKGGTGQSSYILGDLLYGSGTNTLGKLSGNTTTNKLFLTQTGNGTISSAPSWGTIAAGDINALSASTSSTQNGYFNDVGILADSTSYYMMIGNNSSLTANRLLTINTGDADRTLTFTGNASISGTNTGDQSISLQGDVTGTWSGGVINCTVQKAPAGAMTQGVYTQNNTYSTYTTAIPFDDTIPQTSEGAQVISSTITLAATTSKVFITFNGTFYLASSSQSLVAAIFSSASGTNAIKTTAARGSSGALLPVTMEYFDSPNTAGSVTYSVRVGSSGGGNWYINGDNTGRKFGGSMIVSMNLHEVTG